MEILKAFMTANDTKEKISLVAQNVIVIFLFHFISKKLYSYSIKLC